MKRIMQVSFAVSGVGLAVCAIGFLPFIVMFDPDFRHVSQQLARAGFVLYTPVWIAALLWALRTVREGGPRWHLAVACALPYALGVAVLASTAWWTVAEEVHATRAQVVAPGLFVQATGPARARAAFGKQLGPTRMLVGPQVECWTLAPGRTWAVIKRNLAEVRGSDLRISSAIVYYAVDLATFATEGPLTSEAVAARTGLDPRDRIFTGQCDQRR